MSSEKKMSAIDTKIVEWQKWADNVAEMRGFHNSYFDEVVKLLQELKPLIQAEQQNAVVSALEQVRADAIRQLDSLKDKALKSKVGADEYRGITHGRDGMYALIGSIDALITQQKESKQA